MFKEKWWTSIKPVPIEFKDLIGNSFHICLSNKNSFKNRVVTPL